MHVGHPLGYIASDIFARYKRMNGFNVLHPMGFDAFGLPAEQYAIQTGVHPAISTDKNIKRFREQLENMGFSFDWDREVKTCDPGYYKWTQWIFLQLFKPYMDNVHPYNWHWFWHWGTGETLNNATHEIDLCLWALEEKFPNRISTVGGRYHFKDDWQFYDTLLASFEYDDKLITWEGKSCNNMKYYGRGRGVTIHGTKGTVLIDRNGYEIYNNQDEKTFEYVKPQKDETTGLGGGGPMTYMHFQNFIAAITKGEKLNSPIEEGQIPVTMLLLSNVSWKTGKILKIDSANGHVKNDKIMKKHWGREYEPGWEPKV